MSRGNKKLAPAKPVGPQLGKITPKAAAEEAVLHGATQQVLDHAETLISTGRLQVFGFYQKLSRVGLLKEFIQVRESKKYKDIPYRDADGNVRHVGHLDEYCEVFLGRSYQQLAEDAQNLNLLGDELYEQALTLGLTTREFRDIRALPPSDRDLVKQAIGAKNREHVIEIMESLITKHAGEVKALNKQIEGTKADLDAARKVNARSTEKINRLEEKIERRASLPPEEWHREALAALADAGLKVTANLVLVERAVKDIYERDDAPANLRAACGHQVIQIIKAVYEMAARQLDPIDQDALAEEIWPQWMRQEGTQKKAG